jgi:hypothetical protein
MPKSFYDSLDKYVGKLLKDVEMSMQVRVITNQLFIEKVKFLKIEERSENEIYEEILSQEYQLIKVIPSKFISGSNSLNITVSYKFKYRVEKETMLFYFVWMDNLGNAVKPERDFEIVYEGDTFTLQ